jgi:trans-aconitate methyltransferase
VAQEFDFQWRHLDSKNIEYNSDRVREFLQFTTLDPIRTIRQKYCLDAGCGNGRYTFAMLKIGAMRIDSFDISPEAVEKCKQVNPDARVFNLMDLQSLPRAPYEFVFCWGVLNHIENPREGFRKVASQVSSSGGILHIMVYNKNDQLKYDHDRKLWSTLSHEEKLDLCKQRSKTIGGDIHAWWDALNPKYNWSFLPEEVGRWFKEEGFCSIKITQEHQININGVKGEPAKKDYGFF